VQEHGKETCLLERDTTAEQANHVRDEIERVLAANATAQPPRKGMK
jgi:hypothetical protein